jgi:hypothetical protein
MEPGVSVRDDMVVIAEDGEAVVGGEGGDRGGGSEQGRPAGEVIVESGGGVGNDADGEVDACNGLEHVDVGRVVVNGGVFDSAQVAAVEEEEEARISASVCESLAECSVYIIYTLNGCVYRVCMIRVLEGKHTKCK